MENTCQSAALPSNEGRGQWLELQVPPGLMRLVESWVVPEVLVQRGVATLCTMKAFNRIDGD